MSESERIAAAIKVASRYGGIEDDHHRCWVIDQMLRCLMTPEAYAEFVRTRTLGENGEPDQYEPWDRGIAP